MDELLKLFLTMLAAFTGGTIFKKLGLLTPMLTGSIIGVSAITLLFPGSTWFPLELKTVVQIMSGAVIGSRVSRKNLHEMKKLAVPGIILISSLMVLNVISAVGMLKAGIPDIPTAMFASAPGGMSDMTLMSPDFGADPVYVAVIQFSRLLFVNMTFPPLIKFIDRKKLYPGPVRPIIPPEKRHNTEGTAGPLWLTALLALCGGLSFKLMGIPSGAILGSAFFVALQTIKYDRISIPSRTSMVVQLGIGCYIGVQMVRESLHIIATAAMPVAVLFIVCLIYTYICSLVVYRIAHFDFTTCMLMCSPGGLNEMSIIADEIGADAPKVAVMHSVRLLCIVGFFYNLIGIIEMLV